MPDLCVFQKASLEVSSERLFIPWWGEVRLIVGELEEGVVGKVVCLTQN